MEEKRKGNVRWQHTYIPHAFKSPTVAPQQLQVDKTVMITTSVSTGVQRMSSTWSGQTLSGKMHPDAIPLILSTVLTVDNLVTSMRIKMPNAVLTFLQLFQFVFIYHTIHQLKAYSSMGFSIFTDTYNCHHNLILWHFQHWRSPTHTGSHSPFLFLPSTTTSFPGFFHLA